MNLYEVMKREYHYNATYFLQMLYEKGGVAAAKTLLASRTPQQGLHKLWELGRLDMSVEAAVMSDNYSVLFTADEVQEARKRMEDLGYIPGA